jgi:hypothetical protein
MRAPLLVATTSLSVGGGSAQAPQAPPAPTAPVLPTANALAAGERGFATPKVEVAGVSLKVTLANTADQPIRLSVAATAKAGHRSVRFGRARATLAAGQTRTLTLRAVHKAHGRITRPVVTVRNVDTGGALSVKPHVH